MSDRVLTLKYRPRTFAELLVQDHVKRTLVKAIEQQRFANAYLFTGPRGVGKTTTARILAKSLNCLSSDRPTVDPCNECAACTEISGSRSMDVLEIDGASNRGIDQVRELRENIKYSPASLRYKMYIIDEVHMLTPEAFNALLKTLEEPPAHAKFVFATTAAHKVPSTIVSRCQRFDFRKASPGEVAGRLRWLAGKESIIVSEPALLAIARRADGAIRDGESILEQLATFRPEGIELSDVEELLGLVPAELFSDFVDRLLAGDGPAALKLIGQVVDQGHDLLEFYSGLVQHLRGMLFVRTSGSAEHLGLTPAEQERLAAQARATDPTRLVKALETMLRNEESAKYSQMPQVNIECLALELTGLLGAAPKQSPAPPEPTPKEAGRKPGAGNPKPEPDAPAVSGETRAPDPGPRTDTLWQELGLKVRARKPLLASFLDLCRAEAYDNDTLTVACPDDNPAAFEKLKADARLLENLLGSVTGRPSRVELVARKPAAAGNAAIERVAGVFGAVEEIRKRR